jgi:putative Ca2+/H+ antiporter (TMEM165/GDT1 family)
VRLTHLAAAFGAVFIAELPDKSMVAMLVLTGRTKRPLAVWLGASGAFVLQAAIAVAAGRLIALLPGEVVAAVAAVLFGAGAWILWHEGDGDEALLAERAAARRFRSVVALTFGVIAISEFGDLTQLTIAALAARTKDPFAIGIGGAAALIAIAGLATSLGGMLQRRLPMRALHRGAAVVFVAFALLAVIDIIR